MGRYSTQTPLSSRSPERVGVRNVHAKHAAADRPPATNADISFSLGASTKRAHAAAVPGSHGPDAGAPNREP